MNWEYYEERIWTEKIALTFHTIRDVSTGENLVRFNSKPEAVLAASDPAMLAALEMAKAKANRILEQSGDPAVGNTARGIIDEARAAILLAKGK